MFFVSGKVPVSPAKTLWNCRFTEARLQSRPWLKALGEIDGLRLAEPGEFTYRAMCNGRLDISQVEGLADLIDAETEAQRRQAMRIVSGELGRKAAEWNKAVTRGLALLEACIDFADEEIPESAVGKPRAWLTR